jgi:hypothetical protein
MRSRYQTFASVRAEHVYQARALAPVRLPLRSTRTIAPRESEESTE